MKRWIALGAVLIVVGLASFVANLTGVGAQILQPGLLSLAGLAAGFLAAYVYTSWYGLLIPGCILSSLWLGAALTKLVPSWPGDLEGAIGTVLLGTSFFAIYLVDRTRTGRRRIWAVWVGVGLVLFSILVALGGLIPEVLLGSLFIAVPGVVLLIIYFWRRIYPLLIPGCYMIAFGLVIPVLESVPEGTEMKVVLVMAALMLALGVASLAIFIVDRLYTRASNRWPLIPALVGLLGGGLLGFTAWGLGLTTTPWQVLGEVLSNLWPLGLIVFGLWLVLRWAVRGRRTPENPIPPEET